MYLCCIAGTQHKKSGKIIFCVITLLPMNAMGDNISEIVHSAQHEKLNFILLQQIIKDI